MNASRSVALSDPQARVPWPGVPGRFLPAEPFSVDPLSPFWSALLRDGTLKPAPDKSARAVPTKG